jgi:dihydrofolate reductase
MTSLDSIKHQLIDQILITKNEKLLQAIETIFSTTINNEKLSLKTSQVDMLKMSEKDIEEGNLVSETDLENFDLKWMV